MPHDQVWKLLIWTFFREFMELCFEDVARQLNFDQIELLDKEQFTDLPEGQRRELDLVVKISSRDGTPDLVLVHVEIQRQDAADMSEHIWEYYCPLVLRHKLPVFPVVVYLCPGVGGLTEATWDCVLFGRLVS